MREMLVVGKVKKMCCSNRRKVGGGVESGLSKETRGTDG